ncbi:hypothetical protein K493DRAFT_301202 [Basidiobolus meristosporus CBS 931.73]|uniref:Solute carrier family 40 member n=1 Tax=Basidiobolus meristosporus CBS 931.73 TaxID=1314790 RepID=A0A1Y1YD34_9FUNG|nr:hypothetical protein K493DRAFT_301202 [Basidiobolus meristosporus CBS 931.73]|eukprot:ORX95902.1 hypothetical protein K493DRAFT_301202 [Basidiobolus meristosporus CBS 931.73]
MKATEREQMQERSALLAEHAPRREHQVPYIWLYLYHTFNTWSDRFYEFATFVFIMDIFKNTLLPSSLYGFVFTASGILLSSSVGKWIDRTPRLRAIQVFVPIKRLSVALISLGFIVLFAFYDYEVIPDSAKPMCYTIFGAIVLLGGTLKLASVGASIVVEKDWLVVIAQSDSVILTRANSFMRRIELVNKMITPLAFGLIVSLRSTMFCVVFTGIWSIFSMVCELYLIRKVYDSIPWLSETKEPTLAQYFSIVNHEDGAELGEQLDRRESEPWPRRLYNDWLEYYKHPIFAVSLSYAMVYMSVLSVAGTMVSWLKWRGYSDSSVGIMRSVMALLAILGTFLMPLMSRFLGLMKTAQIAVSLEWVALIPVIITFFLSPSWLTTVLLIGGISLSRTCVWIFDLSQMQILQEQISNGQTGLIHGWHFTLCNLFDLGQFLLTIIWSDPRIFKIPAMVSFCMVFLAACTFTRFYYRSS